MIRDNRHIRHIGVRKAITLLDKYFRTDFENGLERHAKMIMSVKRGTKISISYHKPKNSRKRIYSRWNRRIKEHYNGPILTSVGMKIYEWDNRYKRESYLKYVEELMK